MSLIKLLNLKIYVLNNNLMLDSFFWRNFCKKPKNLAMRCWEGKIFSMNRAILFSREANDAFTGFLSHELARDKAHRLKLPKEFSRIFFHSTSLFLFFKAFIETKSITHILFLHYLSSSLCVTSFALKRILQQFLGEDWGETGKYLLVFCSLRRAKGRRM